MEASFTATGIWLRRMGHNGERIEVLVEIDGEWRLAITEIYDSQFSQIAEAAGQGYWPKDEL